MNRTILAAGAMLALAACTPAGTTILTGDFYLPTTELNRHEVSIVAVDGQFYNFAREVRVDPGVHSVVLVSRKRPTLRGPREQQVVAVKTEPCKRYYLAAQHPGGLSDRWTLVVDRVDDVPLCRPDAPAGSGKGALLSVSPGA